MRKNKSKFTNKDKRFIKTCGNYACDILLLNSYAREWRWFNDDMESKTKRYNEVSRVRASISVDLVYKSLYIDVYPIILQSPESGIFETIFHEFCHAITEHQYDVVCNVFNEKLTTKTQIEDAREHETSLIQNAFVWLLTDPRRYKETSKFINSLKTVKRQK